MEQHGSSAAASSELAARTGIPTRGAFGYQFRSRLEAKWAHLFTALGWRWEHEPLDLDGWLPDFLLHTQPLPTLVEVKPESTLKDLATYTPKIERAIGENAKFEVLLLGCTPFPFPENDWTVEPLGLLGEFVEGSRSYDAAEWMTCRKCQAVSFHHSVGSFRSRVCSHYDGDSYLGEPPVSRIQLLWASACNAVQWRAR